MACLKSFYVNKATADREIDRLRRKPDPRRAKGTYIPREAYYCPQCDGYHIAYPTKRKAVPA